MILPKCRASMTGTTARVIRKTPLMLVSTIRSHASVSASQNGNGRSLASALVDIGTTLSRVKDKVGHGRWGSWLLIEFSMSVSTAERYMRVAKWAADKIVTVTNLQPSTLYILSAKSTPPSLAHEVLNRLEANDPISEKDLTAR